MWGRKRVAQWSAHDQAVLETCRMMADMAEGRSRSEPLAPFPTKLAAGERMLAHARYDLWHLRHPLDRARGGPAAVVVERGDTWVSTAGIYFMAERGTGAWPWTSINTGRMVGPGRFQMHAEGRYGPVAWAVSTLWAELAFLLWARSCHPHHPQLISGAWVPPGWVERCKEHQDGLPQGPLALPAGS